MSSAEASKPRTSPLARAAQAVPPAIAAMLAAAAMAAAIALAARYAYAQDVLFPERHFPRTWLLVGVMAAAAVLSLAALWGMPRRVGAGAFLASLGAGTVFFGAANLANRETGIAALGLAAVAWLAVAAAAQVRGAAVRWVVIGLFAGAGVVFAAVAFSVVAVSGSA